MAEGASPDGTKLSMACRIFCIIATFTDTDKPAGPLLKRHVAGGMLH